MIVKPPNRGMELSGPFCGNHFDGLDNKEQTNAGLGYNSSLVISNIFFPTVCCTVVSLQYLHKTLCS